MTTRAKVHTLDSVTHSLREDDLDETPDTVPRHHRSRQRSSTSTVLPTHPRAVFSISLHRTMIARPEALVRVASPGQALLQIFDLALITIVGILPHDRSHQTRRTHDTKTCCQGRVSHSLNLSLYCYFSQLTVHVLLTSNTYMVYIYTNDGHSLFN